MSDVPEPSLVGEAAAIASPAAVARLIELVDAMFGEMTTHQRIKVRELGRKIVPGITDEDIRNAQDFPALMADATFNFEDGTLSGLIAAHIALKRRLLHPLLAGEAPEPALDPIEVELRFYEARLRDREREDGGA